MQRLLLRLDDASEYMDIKKWKKMELLLDKYNVKPLFGVIPANADRNLLKYGKVEEFWELVHSWIAKGWIPALHGYAHVFETKEGGCNPVNKRSEFAGVPYEKQAQKIRDGISILNNHGVKPKIFYAPAHTFDENTIKALKAESDIKIISDTPANDSYVKEGITFVPQQSGRVRRLPFSTVTYCYHPNTMNDLEFDELENFLRKNPFSKFPEIETENKLCLLDMLLMKLYYMRRK